MWRLQLGLGGAAFIVGSASLMEFANEPWVPWVIGIGYVVAMAGAVGSGLTSCPKLPTGSEHGHKKRWRRGPQ